MPEYILIPTPIKHPTFSELELLIRRVGHDFLSDIHSAYGIIDLLSERDIVDTDRKSWAIKGTTALKHATNISRALTELGTSRPQPTKFELRELLEEVKEYTIIHLGMDVASFAEKSVSSPQCFNHFNVLYMQLFNFMQNARDSYDGKNSPRAELGAEIFCPSEQELHYLGRNAERYTVKDELVRVWVKDEGKGIPQEKLSTIFRPGVTTKSNGSGLGLSLVDYICDFVHGFAKVESEVGEGSRFSLYFAKERKLV